ncbi:MAG: 3-isopropylmalate dehydrogenase [Clostridium sp.]|nr:3-isopropylmalate dehydrogenase [Clostridium sp.]
MSYKIAVIQGDGIGPEVVNEAILVLKKVEEEFNHKFEIKYLLAGGCAIDKVGIPLPKETLEVCQNSDAVILGAVGGYKWDDTSAKIRPEQALLGLREGLNLYCNLRPALLYKPLKNSSPLKDELVKNGIDIVVVRELTGGIYFGAHGRSSEEGVEVAFDTEKYNKEEVKRIAKIAFEIAMKRNKKVTSVDKANILESSRLWRETIIELSKEYKEVELNHMYIDNASMQLVRNPSQFDVIVTSNMFGDILSDEASMIAGSIGMLPSASLGDSKLGLYEPIHGSAPDIVGKDIANPLATILSVAMMLRYSLNLEEEAKAIENAVAKVLEDGYRTKDIYSEGTSLVGTRKMGQLVIERLMKV